MATHAHGAPAGAHPAGGAHAHADHAHGHHGHDPADVAGDKRAAFVGLVGGLALIGALMYGMVLWTNAQFAGHAEGGARSGAAAPAAQH